MKIRDIPHFSDAYYRKRRHAGSNLCTLTLNLNSPLDHPQKTQPQKCQIHSLGYALFLVLKQIDVSQIDSGNTTVLQNLRQR